jgi:hypothetical protein
MRYRFIPIFFLSVIFEPTMGQDREGWKELIIKVPKLDEWSVYKISRQLKCLDGVHLSGYYQPTSCLLLKYNPSILSDPEIVKVVLFRLNNKMKNHYVKGFTIFDVIDGKYTKSKKKISKK